MPRPDKSPSDDGSDDERSSPGPGTYTGSLPTLVSKSFNKGKAIKQFGSEMKRFIGPDSLVNPQKVKLPGPGQYRPEVSQEFLDNKKNEVMPKSAVFMKKSDRNHYTLKGGAAVPGVGTYDITQYELGSKYNKGQHLATSASKRDLHHKMSVSSFAPHQQRSAASPTGAQRHERSVSHEGRQNSVDSSFAQQ